MGGLCGSGGMAWEGPAILVVWRGGPVVVVV